MKTNKEDPFTNDSISELIDLASKASQFILMELEKGNFNLKNKTIVVSLINEAYLADNIGKFFANMGVKEE
jgi:hypothetical protein